MTREEAIERIKMILEEATANEDAVSYVTSYDAEALDMAIKALEREPKLQNRCFALTQGQMCLFCPYECEHKAESRGKE
jgi:hypothetical protein